MVKRPRSRAITELKLSFPITRVKIVEKYTNIEYEMGGIDKLELVLKMNTVQGIPLELTPAYLFVKELKEMVMLSMITETPKP